MNKKVITTGSNKHLHIKLICLTLTRTKSITIKQNKNTMSIYIDPVCTANRYFHLTSTGQVLRGKRRD